MPHLPAAPPPPWHLAGAAVLLMHNLSSVLALVHYDSSPVGSYDELAVATIGRHGPTVYAMLVTSAASRRGGRQNWGFPKELAPLRWRRGLCHLGFQAGARRWRFRPWGPSVPVRCNLWTVQSLEGELVQVPCAVRGRLRLAWRGRQLALLLEPFGLTVSAPRRMR